LGLLLGRVIPGLDSTLSSVEVGSVSLPIAAGLLVMMYPVLAKVRYGEVGIVAADRRMIALVALEMPVREVPPKWWTGRLDGFGHARLS
jgi:ACR3 family arsenite efflux pump ArsB